MRLNNLLSDTLLEDSKIFPFTGFKFPKAAAISKPGRAFKKIGGLFGKQEQPPGESKTITVQGQVAVKANYDPDRHMIIGADGVQFRPKISQREMSNIGPGRLENYRGRKYLLGKRGDTIYAIDMSG